ncbi:uncharacterized protein FPRO_10330 [Fusarium proliferatum ET1]|uniref:Uncharacterized protein n=1 Tax=Fusarium proliferatum (strain ET1) TaxID=1227346 RepID=A0A1L7VKA1_FUSPR|nr:uncharacterized protein FPRO_10330 [Fusarium proliferatum ET1]CZR40742.1 uncharacterized protein FPRO_10330 [Fusarium proliferatum ET1]
MGGNYVEKVMIEYLFAEERVCDRLNEFGIVQVGTVHFEYQVDRATWINLYQIVYQIVSHRSIANYYSIKKSAKLSTRKIELILKKELDFHIIPLVITADRDSDIRSVIASATGGCSEFWHPRTRRA